MVKNNSYKNSMKEKDEVGKTTKIFLILALVSLFPLFCLFSFFSLSPVASTYPSVITLGWAPSERYLSLSFISSPISSTFDVVPSPVTSSCAVAERAMSAAVGCWICCARWVDRRLDSVCLFACLCIVVVLFGVWWMDNFVFLFGRDYGVADVLNVK